MSEEPQLPPIPDIGIDAITRKKRFYEKINTVVKCGNCHENYTREFKKGDYTFKKLSGESCPKCNEGQSLIITEIFSEWIDPKKEKKKK
ncbi:MAG: hypothetical protein ACTSWE_01050 [Promethearchaeota archaeon]